MASSSGDRPAENVSTSNNTSSNGVVNMGNSGGQNVYSSGPSIVDIFTQLEDYTPTIPDAVTQHYLSTAGVHTDDPRVVRLVSLVAQKFVSDIANDALQHCKMKGTGGSGQQTSKKSKDRKFILTSEDLSLALADQGITLKKPPYYN